MDREEVFRIASEAGMEAAENYAFRGGFEKMPALERDEFAKLERFAELVAAKEREACARICNDIGRGYFDVELHEAVAASIDCTKAIRARGATDGQPT